MSGFESPSGHFICNLFPFKTYDKRLAVFVRRFFCCRRSVRMEFAPVFGAFLCVHSADKTSDVGRSLSLESDDERLEKANCEVVQV